MQAIDTHGQGDYLFDKSRKISLSHLETVCKKGQGKECCRYIGLSVIGFMCSKKTPIKSVLDELTLNNKMKAQGDNCEGLE